MRLKNRLAFYKSKAGAEWRTMATVKHYLSKSPAKAAPVNGDWFNGACRWVENVESVGLRFVCYADKELSYLRHEGYFADHYQDQVIRGAVWQLPARDGCETYVYGWKDPNNEGAACIDFERTDDKTSAAKWADSMAEREAEKQREFYAKDAAAQDIENFREAIHHNNQDALILIKEIKQAGQFTPAICRALKTQLQKMLDYRARQFELIRKRQRDFWSAVEQS